MGEAGAGSLLAACASACASVRSFPIFILVCIMRACAVFVCVCVCFVRMCAWGKGGVRAPPPAYTLLGFAYFLSFFEHIF